MTARPSRRVLCPTVVLCALAFGGCGGGGSGDEATGTPEAALHSYFIALSKGDAKTICAMEAPVLARYKYGGTGGACLHDQSNNRRQAAFGADRVNVGDPETSGSHVTFTIRFRSNPTPVRVGLTRTGGHWRVDSFG